VDDGSGGKDVGTFGATIGFNPTLTWTNRPSGSPLISRRTPLVITWAGGDPAHELAMINGTMSVQSLATSSHGLTATAFFTCIERVDAGQFSVPSFVLSALPISTGAPFLAGGPFGNPEVTIATLSVSSISKFDQNMFLAPGVDAGYFVWMDANSADVTFGF
jgi:hypothetical protein